MPPVSCSSAARRERKQMWSTVLAGAAERIERAKADWSAGRIVESWAGRPLPTTRDALMGYLYVGIFPAVVAFFGWNRGVAAIGPSRASLFSHLIPLFSAGLAYLFLNERIAGFHLAGGALIFLGIFLANR